MITVDKFLLQILNLPDSELRSIPSRDLKVLKSLAKIISSPNFITENQSKLLLKVLNENSSKLGESQADIFSLLNEPTWSKPFRLVDRTKKIYLTKDEPGIIIEFAFSSTLRKVITGIWKEISGLAQIDSGKIYRADLTEKNIVKIVDTFQSHGFDIDEKIEDFYKTIKSWSNEETKNQFLLTNIVHTNFQKSITQDLGLTTEINENIIRDRSNRYHYFVENSEKTPENLTEKIAFRKSNRVWINKTETPLDEVLSSLVILKRFPVLIVFDSNDHKKCLSELVNLNDNLEKLRIFDKVGIYFRLPNDEYGSQFNKFISEHQYNSQLDNTTNVVGVQSGKIPKFFLKTPWKPMSVISIGSSLRQTKTAVYVNNCDLIISYTDQEPIIETRHIWE